MIPDKTIETGRLLRGSRSGASDLVQLVVFTLPF